MLSLQEFFLSAKGKLMEHEASAVERERREWMRIIRAKQVSDFWARFLGACF